MNRKNFKKLAKKKKRQRRHLRVTAKIFGTSRKPRFCVFRSAKHIYGQLVDDEKGKTMISLSDQEIRKPIKNAKTKTKEAGKIAVAYEVGKSIAEKALKEKIESVIFDRGGYKYHGRVKAVAEGAREGGLKF